MDLTLILAHAKHRQMANVHPGWWLRSYEDGDVESWDPVTTVLQGKNVLTGRKVTRCIVTDQKTGEPVMVANYSEVLVLCCTKAEAKRAGLVAREFKADAAVTR